jgi:carboxyl-terminal processing protease
MAKFMARKKVFPLLALCLLLCLLGFAAHAQEASLSSAENSPSTRETRLKVFEQVWRSINDNYYDRNFHGLDWPGQRQLYRQQAETARDSAELYRVLRSMVGKLGDAHTRVYAPEDGFDRYRPAGTTVGMTVRRIEGRVVVTAVETGQEAARQGVRPGMTLLKLDEQPVEQALAKVQDELGTSSTTLAREVQSMDRLFYGARDTIVNLSLLDEENQPLEVTLTRRYVEFQRRVTSRLLAYNFGYIELTGFGPEIEREFEKAMQSMQGTRGVILDLRNNGGGFVSSVAFVASYFFPEGTDLGEFITRQGRASRRTTWRVRTAYRAPLIVLVSSRSASGSEIFAAAVQERKRGLIIGSNPSTCGCLLGVSKTLRLDDGGKLNISDTDFRTALGKRIEGIGVQPDQRIELKVANLLAGRDYVLETAVDALSRNLVFGARGTELDFKLKLPDLKSPRNPRPLPAANSSR